MLKWVTAEGEEYAPVTAKDFVTGLKHAVDGKSKDFQSLALLLRD